MVAMLIFFVVISGQGLFGPRESNFHSHNHNKFWYKLRVSPDTLPFPESISKTRHFRLLQASARPWRTPPCLSFWVIHSFAGILVWLLAGNEMTTRSVCHQCCNYVCFLEVVVCLVREWKVETHLCAFLVVLSGCGGQTHKSTGKYFDEQTSDHAKMRWISAENKQNWNLFRNQYMRKTRSIW